MRDTGTPTVKFYGTLHEANVVFCAPERLKAFFARIFLVISHRK
jgi:hypothetical protein